MKYDIDWLLKQGRQKYVFFWGHRPHPSGVLTTACFSQWWGAPFVVDGITYRTAEHWMMGQKAKLFHDNAAFEEIVKAGSPTSAKSLGRKVRGFNESVWKEHRNEIVVAGNAQKFLQHQDLKDFLLGTGSKVLVEASPHDKIWGIGLSADDKRASNPRLWKGLNLLGFALMEVRDTLSGKIAR